MKLRPRSGGVHDNSARSTSCELVENRTSPQDFYIRYVRSQRFYSNEFRHFSQKLELSPEGRSEPHPYKLIINTMYIIHNAFLILSDECNVECMKVSKSVCRQCALTRNVNSFITFRILLFQ